MNRHLLFIDGKWVSGSSKTTIRSPYTGSPVAEADQTGADQLESAVAAAVRAAQPLAKTSRYLRSALLSRIAKGIDTRRAEIVQSMIDEAGKPWTLADGEVSRAVQTFTWAAEEAKRLGGEVVPIDVDATGRPFEEALCLFKPRGPVLGITPFNFPLNLVAHKVAPALAAGCPILIKSAPQAPGGAAILASIFEAAVKETSDARESIPLAAFQVISASNEIAEKAVKDPRLSTVSFTGSPSVGFRIQAAAIGKKVILELGGNAAVIVHADANLERAAARCAFGGMTYAGQSCISVQRIFVHESVAENFQELLTTELKKVKFGDPALKDTIVGPVIDGKAADRIRSWITESGAKTVSAAPQGQNPGVIPPSMVLNPPVDSKISSEEVFGPVVTLSTYRDFTDALTRVNDSKFGLQAGLFTNQADLISQAFHELEVGGLVVNEVPTFRADHMPYGGVKQSGLGREGLRYAMEEFCERRILVQFRG